MKKILALGAIALMLTSLPSCSKKDHYNESIPVPEYFGWQTVSNWESLPGENGMESRMADPRINNEILIHGLVLAYVRHNAQIHALPADITINGKVQSFTYATEAGEIVLFQEGNQAVGGLEFRYLVITPEQIRKLEQDGTDRDKLMNLTLEDVEQLLRSLQ